jgi:hypothetical protein
LDFLWNTPSSYFLVPPWLYGNQWSFSRLKSQWDQCHPDVWLGVVTVVVRPWRHRPWMMFEKLLVSRYKEYRLKWMQMDAIYICWWFLYPHCTIH